MFRNTDVVFCVLCVSCDSSQYCVLHDLQFVNAGRDPSAYPIMLLLLFVEDCVRVLNCCEFVRGM